MGPASARASVPAPPRPIRRRPGGGATTSRARDSSVASARARDDATDRASRDACERLGGESRARPIGRRDAIASAAALTSLVANIGPRAPLAFAEEPIPARPVNIPDYTVRGPYGVRRLPKLEHTCVSCFPRCVGDACLLSIDAYVPSAPPPLPDNMFPLIGVDREGEDRTADSRGVTRGPFPLAVLTSGFLVDAEQYASYARRLCSWGYVVLQYNKRESVGVAGGNALDDVVSAAMVKDLIGWAQSDVLLGPQIDRGDVRGFRGVGGAFGRAADDEHDDDVRTGGVYLIGHSRGGKISMLDAVEDSRVRAACLLDPVDNTVYAPLGEGFPSAVAAMRDARGGPPVVVVGGTYGGDCAPEGSNYLEFLREASEDSWGVEIRAGHFQFLDSAGFVQRAVCEEGVAADAQVRELSQALMVAHAETVFRGVPREPALRQTLRTMEETWGNGAFGASARVAGGELPWVVLKDGASRRAS